MQITSAHAGDMAKDVIRDDDLSEASREFELENLLAWLCVWQGRFLLRAEPAYDRGIASNFGAQRFATRCAGRGSLRRTV
jgi:hypothetical protein